MGRDTYGPAFAMMFICALFFVGSVIAMFNVKKEDIMIAMFVVFLSAFWFVGIYKMIHPNNKKDTKIEDDVYNQSQLAQKKPKVLGINTYKIPQKSEK